MTFILDTVYISVHFSEISRSKQLYLTDHVGYSISLGDGNLPCFLVHPLQIVEVLLESVPHSVDHHLCLCLGVLMEDFSNKDSTDRKTYEV